MRSLIAVLACIALSPVAAAAQGPDRPIGIILKAGIITPGAFYFEEGPYDSYDLSLSPAVGVAVDYLVAPRLAVGAFTDVANLSAFDESALMIDVGVTLKAHLGEIPAANEPRRLHVSPMLSVGYASLGEIYVFERTQYLTLKLGTELRWGRTLFEISAFGAPSGGNADVTTSFGPVAHLRMGWAL